VTSSASCSDIGGRIDGSLRASIVFPQPGGPTNKKIVAAGRRDFQRAFSGELSATKWNKKS